MDQDEVEVYEHAKKKPKCSKSKLVNETDDKIMYVILSIIFIL